MFGYHSHHTSVCEPNHHQGIVFHVHHTPFGYTKKDLISSIKSSGWDTKKSWGSTITLIPRSELGGTSQKPLPGFGNVKYMPKRYYEAVYRRLLETQE